MAHGRSDLAMTLVVLAVIIAPRSSCVGQTLGGGVDRVGAARSLVVYVIPATLGASSPLPSATTFATSTVANAMFGVNHIQRRDWATFDKVQHATFAFLFTLGTQYTLSNKLGVSSGRSAPIAVGTGISVGLGKELYDWRISSTGRFDGRDLVADLVGVALAAVVILI